MYYGRSQDTVRVQVFAARRSYLLRPSRGPWLYLTEFLSTPQWVRRLIALTALCPHYHQHTLWFITNSAHLASIPNLILCSVTRYVGIIYSVSLRYNQQTSHNNTHYDTNSVPDFWQYSAFLTLFLFFLLLLLLLLYFLTVTFTLTLTRAPMFKTCRIQLYFQI